MIINKTHAKFVEFQKLCKEERLPSARLVADKVGVDLKALKRFAVAHDFDELYNVSLFRCSLEAARLLLEGQITREAAVNFLKDNGHDAQRLDSFKELVQKKG